jgi:hypothetical protein
MKSINWVFRGIKLQKRQRGDINETEKRERLIDSGRVYWHMGIGCSRLSAFVIDEIAF